MVQDVNLSTELALRRQHRARFQQALPVERAIDSMLRSGSAGGVVASKKEIGTKRTASDMGRGLPQAKRTNRAHSSSTSSDERHDSVATLLQQLIAADIPCLTDFASIPDIAAEVQVEETEISRVCSVFLFCDKHAFCQLLRFLSSMSDGVTVSKATNDGYSATNLPPHGNWHGPDNNVRWCLLLCGSVRCMITLSRCVAFLWVQMGLLCWARREVSSRASSKWSTPVSC